MESKYYSGTKLKTKNGFLTLVNRFPIAKTHPRPQKILVYTTEGIRKELAVAKKEKRITIKEYNDAIKVFEKVFK